jgi:hypothetical protein
MTARPPACLPGAQGLNQDEYRQVLLLLLLLLLPPPLRVHCEMSKRLTSWVMGHYDFFRARSPSTGGSYYRENKKGNSLVLL